MRKKITIFLISALLISSTTTLAFTTFNRDEQEMKNVFFDTKPVPLPVPKGWNRTFGGIANDMCFSVEQTFDGGYIISGWTFSFGAGKVDFWLIKTDSYGIEEWNRTFGGTNYDYGKSGHQTTDGGYIITGMTNFSYNTGCGDFGLIKTNNNGIEEWNRTFGGTNVDQPYSIQQTSDGGYIITGVTSSFGAGNEDVYLVKTDADGNKVWDKTFGGINQDKGYFVQQTSDGGYIITGGTYSFSAGSDDIWLIKTNANGDEIWNRTFGGTSSDNGYSVQQTIDGGYIIIGYTYLFGAGKEDIWLIKTDTNGNKVWDKTFGGIDHDEGNSVQQTSDGGYIITGYTDSFDDGDYNIWLIKIDTNGDEIWNRTFGGTTTEDSGLFVQQTGDEGYIILGRTRSYSTGDYNVLLIKTDSQGKSKPISLFNMWLEKLVQRFPFFEKILNQMLI
jgi:hypothetical protein